MTMPISESDISLLIPTYRYRDKVGRAVESALASGAEEIIVTDDRSGDGTIELLAGYDDPRLRVYENATNLGLWENHLAALGYATKPWIKFIQADDYLLPGGLAAYAAAADSGASIVWTNPIVVDDDTGSTYAFHQLTTSWRLTGEQLLELAIVAGWVLGTPSQFLVRADAVTRDPVAWGTEISADVLLGVLASRCGDAVLLPSGGIVHSVHSKQDAKTQGRRRGLRRLVATTNYLKKQADPVVQRFASLWAAQNRRGIRRTALSGVLRWHIPMGEAVSLVLHNEALASGCSPSGRDKESLRAGHAFRRNSRPPHDIDAILAQHILAERKSIV